LIYNFIITTIDRQGKSQGEDISTRAYALVRPGVTPPLGLVLSMALPSIRIIAETTNTV